VIDALPPPRIEQPAAYQVSYGVVAGVAPAGTARIVVRVGGRVLADRHLDRRRFRVIVTLPPRDATVRVVAVSARGASSAAQVEHVFGLPTGARPRPVRGFEDAGLTRQLTGLGRGFASTGGIAGIYVRSLTTGRGAAWNARATFPAASTLKLAIALAVLAHSDGPPAPGSAVDTLMRSMLVFSDNSAANALETRIGGSTSGGSSLVMGLLKSIGIESTVMYGGYETKSLEGEIPARVDSQPSFPIGKQTTAFDLASLSRALWLASGGLGPLRTAATGVTPAEARYLLYVLTQVRDHGKLDRTVGSLASVVVLHKAGWIDSARHDSGLVFWRDGVFSAAVMTWNPNGTGAASDLLAGRVASAMLGRLRG
jgi:hypothetical protein